MTASPLPAPHRRRAHLLAGALTLLSALLTVRYQHQPTGTSGMFLVLCAGFTLVALWAARSRARQAIWIDGVRLHLRGMDGTHATVPLTRSTRIQFTGPTGIGPAWQARLTRPGQPPVLVEPHMVDLGAFLVLLSPYARLAADEFTRIVLTDPDNPEGRTSDPGQPAAA